LVVSGPVTRIFVQRLDAKLDNAGEQDISFSQRHVRGWMTWRGIKCIMNSPRALLATIATDLGRAKHHLGRTAATTMTALVRSPVRDANSRS